ncbi:VOC family protein [Knoellia subterranea]|uniref:Glyoxalase n=1 Tax=Knoellia subterranea KCTC 19937 TaxID=1385521 RepID=A0A0A0JM36_9MICO|nr:VOC family protein [Knoellia subterranea]KGN37097.1 glyoxalase [Knoellia subterranea KCTC 19937]
MGEHPAYLHTVLDGERPRELAEFYRQLLGLVYRPGDEPPTDGTPDTADWLVLTQPDGTRQLAIQQVSEQARTTWPDQRVPQQAHIDYVVEDRAALERHKHTALRLGAELRLDRTDDEDEPLYVLADPAGHTFCLFVG